MCVFLLGGESFAMDLRHVAEVFEVESVTAVPGMPRVLVGVTNLRGTIVSLVDLRETLEVSLASSVLPFAVVMREGAKLCGVLVDDVPEIRTVSRNDLLPALQSGPYERRPGVSLVLRLGSRLCGVLDVTQVFAQIEGGSGGTEVEAGR
ncbi:purine-binding chemotaxis protein CheW [Nitrospirales bacterium NOB]|nr:purine-binding chemotaxis protein CheW [Nitrospirales bacterium NOB]MEB2339819.1 chemotaxis protein CheW [Nitrospirales bacterium]